MLSSCPTLLLRMTAQLWRKQYPCCLSPRQTATVNAGVWRTRWLNSPRRQRSHPSHPHAKDHQQNTICLWCPCWTFQTPLRHARPFQVKQTGFPCSIWGKNNHKCIFIPEDRERKNSDSKGHDCPGSNRKRRKSRERRSLTLREERRKRCSIPITSSLSHTAKEQQPGTSTGQVCLRSKSTKLMFQVKSNLVGAMKEPVIPIQPQNQICFVPQGHAKHA